MCKIKALLIVCTPTEPSFWVIQHYKWHIILTSWLISAKEKHKNAQNFFLNTRESRKFSLLIYSGLLFFSLRFLNLIKIIFYTYLNIIMNNSVNTYAWYNYLWEIRKLTRKKVDFLRQNWPVYTVLPYTDKTAYFCWGLEKCVCNHEIFILCL